MSETAVSVPPRESLARQISRRVLLLSLTTVVVIAAAVGLTLLATLQQVEGRLAEANIEASTAFDLFLRDIQSDLLSTSSSLAVSTNREALLLNMRVRNPSLLDVLLVDAQGQVLAQRSAAFRPRQARLERQPWLAPPAPPPPGVSQRPRALRPSEVYVGPVGFHGQAPAIDMAAIVTDAVGVSAGSLVARVDLTELWNATLGLRVGETGYVFITDETGQLIAHRDRRLVEAGSRLGNLRGRSPQVIAASPWSIYRSLSGRRVIASARPLKTVPWYAVVELPLQEALRPFFKVTAVLLLVLALVVGLVYGLQRFTRRSIVRPLMALSEAVERMSAGRWDQQIVASRPDELGQLAHSFNVLAGQLRSSFDTLEAQVRVLRLSEAERRTAEEKYRNIFEFAVEGIFQSTPDGRFLTANPALARMLGFDSPEHLLAQVGDIATQLYVDAGQREAFRRALDEEGWVQGFETQARRRDGRTIWTSLSARSVKDPAGHVLYYEGTAEDITERKRSEEATLRLQESLRRSETMSAMGMLVAGVAHEVRNPLFAISSNLDVFEASIEPGSEFAPCVSVLRGEVDRLAALMRDLLDFGKPVQSAPQEGPVEAVVDEAIGRCAALASQRRVTITRRLPPGLPSICMDRERMVQVFQNLLANAIQHSPEGGSVTVAASHEGAGFSSSIVLEVADSGPGIAHEDLGHVFTPFFSRRRGGTGLGLAIVQRIVDEHRGSVTAANRPEGGARITVRLPGSAVATAG